MTDRDWPDSERHREVCREIISRCEDIADRIPHSTPRFGDRAPNGAGRVNVGLEITVSPDERDLWKRVVGLELHPEIPTTVSSLVRLAVNEYLSNRLENAECPKSKHAKPE